MKEIIYILLAEQGKIKDELAKALNMDKQTLELRFAKQNFREMEIREIAKFFNVPIMYLFEQTMFCDNCIHSGSCYFFQNYYEFVNKNIHMIKKNYSESFKLFMSTNLNIGKMCRFYQTEEK